MKSYHFYYLITQKKENIKHLKTDYGPPGVSPITDETSKPFSVLSDFKDRLT